MISKPIVPPFDDSAKNIVVNQARFGRRYRYRVLGGKGTPPPAPGVIVAPVYEDAGDYSPRLSQNLRVMGYGLRARGAVLYHYFFAPNTVTSLAGRLQQRVARVKTVQTVCSVPRRFDKVDALLFSDRVIVLSEETRKRMIAAGVAPGRLAHVPPGIAPIPRADDSARRAARAARGVPDRGRMVLFPGDYEFSSAAATVAQAAPLIAARHADATLVFACRIKRPPSLLVRDRIRAELDAKGLSSRVIFLERVDDMPAFVGAADVVIMPADSLYAKMDVPLVLLEAMSQAVPLVLADVPPLSELTATGAGLVVAPRDPEALADAVGRLLDNPREAADMGAAGQTTVNDNYHAEKSALRVEAIYDEVLESER